MSGPLRAPPAILLLAAGASSRMRGEDKLLREIDGTPLILRAARAACAAARHVVIVLPSDPARRASLGDVPATLLEVADRAMSASLAAGVAACPPGAVMVHLADMPEIGADDLWTLVRHWQGARATIMRAGSADGAPGHPVIFDAAHRPALAALTEDSGARALLGRHEAEIVPLPGRRALVDLDTPEDWAVWEAARRGG